MKTLSLALALAIACLTAGSARAYTDPNPFADYGAAMKSTPEHPLAAEWSRENYADIAWETRTDKLAAFVADDRAAWTLLAKLGPAYETDPIVLTQIAAVTQWVMTEEPFFLWFWKPSPADGREIWRKALRNKINSSFDEYVKTFCRQQLRLCE